FNGTNIPGNSTIWLSSVLSASNLGSGPVTINFTNQTIQCSIYGSSYSFPVPNASVTFSPTATTSTTTFNTSANQWVTVVPLSTSGNVFLSGLSYAVPSYGLPGGISGLNWCGTFSSTTPNVKVNWKWAAADYKNFGASYPILNVKPVDDNSTSSSKNSDHAGTPEAYKNYVTGGCMGGGGSNYTGSYTGTASVTICQVMNALAAPPAADGSATFGYTPAQIRSAYGINNLSLDGTGQTIAVVDAYGDPAIFQALDAFDSRFGATSTGPSLYAQYGSASSFLTVLNQNGQTGSLPATDPNGADTNNWERETALDVEWLHAIAPGARIILVEANSQSLADLMAGVGTAASQPGVSVVSMSWGFAEGAAALQQDETLYDRVLTTPAGHQGVTFVASTGDYGAADPEYPAFSPNVIAVGGTSLYLNPDNTYGSETTWGNSASGTAGTFAGSGGGVSQYELEPSYQQGVQATGYRTTPDVSFVGDPATGVWIADTYNQDAGNPWQVAGGTSLSAPSWAGLIVLANEGRAAAGETPFDASSVSAQAALYHLPQSDYTAVTSAMGDATGAGYQAGTGLGSPVANLLVRDLIAYSATVNATTVVPADLGGNRTNEAGNTIPAEGIASQTAASFGLGHLSGPASHASSSGAAAPPRPPTWVRGRRTMASQDSAWTAAFLPKWPIP
ncbi:MAG TPA: S53 family peptidase, partial [Gemmataceae bacterium]|nr:S53 family peptidase [Gemmataceae bacterium]